MNKFTEEEIALAKEIVEKTNISVNGKPISIEKLKDVAGKGDALAGAIINARNKRKLEIVKTLAAAIIRVTSNG